MSSPATSHKPGFTGHLSTLRTGVPPKPFLDVKAAAEMPNATPPAFNELARRYWDGVGTPQDTTLALRWFHRSIAAGDVDAMFAVGELHLYQRRKMRSIWTDHIAEARECFERAAATDRTHPKAKTAAMHARNINYVTALLARVAADPDDSEAHFELFLFYRYSYNSAYVYAPADEWWTKELFHLQRACGGPNSAGSRSDQQDIFLALQRDAAAPTAPSSVWTDLARLHWEGLGTIRNRGAAVALFLKAAERDDPRALFTIGLFYISGVTTEGSVVRNEQTARVVLQCDLAQARKYLTRVLELHASGSGSGRVSARQREYATKTLKELAEATTKVAAADAGDLQAICWVIDAYGKGNSVLGHNDSKRFRYLELLFKFYGHPSIWTLYPMYAVQLGNAYWRGLGTRVDKRAAVRLYKLAADANDPNGFYHTATVHYLGVPEAGIDVNVSEARRYGELAVVKAETDRMTDRIRAKFAEFVATLDRLHPIGAALAHPPLPPARATLSPAAETELSDASDRKSIIAASKASSSSSSLSSSLSSSAGATAAASASVASAPDLPPARPRSLRKRPIDVEPEVVPIKVESSADGVAVSPQPLARTNSDIKAEATRLATEAVAGELQAKRELLIFQGRMEAWKDYESELGLVDPLQYAYEFINPSNAEPLQDEKSDTNLSSRWCPVFLPELEPSSPHAVHRIETAVLPHAALSDAEKKKRDKQTASDAFGHSLILCGGTDINTTKDFSLMHDYAEGRGWRVSRESALIMREFASDAMLTAIRKHFKTADSVNGKPIHIHFSGHGSEPSQAAPAVAGCAASGRPNKIRKTTAAGGGDWLTQTNSLSLTTLMSEWNKSKAKKAGAHLVLTIDACHSGGWVELARNKDWDVTIQCSALQARATSNQGFTLVWTKFASALIHAARPPLAATTAAPASSSSSSSAAAASAIVPAPLYHAATFEKCQRAAELDLRRYFPVFQPTPHGYSKIPNQVLIPILTVRSTTTAAALP